MRNSRPSFRSARVAEPEGQGDAAERLAAEALIVDVAGFEGPLDLLLALGRTQKVDLRRISILELARQYLAFVEAARGLRIELAADYLVMAAWLAYLKSRLLLPPDPADAGPGGEAMADHLAFRLARLGAMRDAAASLMARDRLGREVFARGAPEAVGRTLRVRTAVTLLDLARAYGRVRTRDAFRPLVLDRDDIFTMEAALVRLRDLAGAAPGWTTLAHWLPEGWRAPPARRRSATAAHFAAMLELAKSGTLDVRQRAPFAALQVRPRGGR